MKILVTGGAGFIGSHVVDIYLENGHEVVVIDDLSTGRLENLNPAAKFYEVDICDPHLRDIFLEEKPQIINHHAAQMDVRKSIKDPDFDARVNILAPVKMLEYALESGVSKFIHISSGGAIYGEPEYLPCDEDHPVIPLSPYGASKYTFELYLNIYKQVHGLDYSILRYANIYGPRQDPHGEAGVVAIFTGQMIKNLSVTIHGSGEQVRDFVFVSDIAAANLKSLHLGSGQAFNLGSGNGTTINQIFTILSEITSYDQPANYGPAKKGETYRIYLDSSRAKQALAWTANVNLNEGLHKTVEYFNKNEIR
jgi:UDP-glucose 4-epimerase